MKVEIIYQDEYFICVTKPNNVVVHHAHHSRNVADEKSLLQLLLDQTGNKLYPIHRLDRKTSGIILLCKDKKFVSKFQQLFTQNQIEKAYLGVVRGHAPDKLIMDSPVKGRDAKIHKEAETELNTLQTITLNIPVKPYDTSRYSLVKLTPKTGRLHQLRIHTNKISHPLIGDPKYGDKNHNLMFIKEFSYENLFLHAYKLIFKHPFTNEELVLKSSLPEDWNDLLKKFDWEVY
ncbi:Pseudouridine synthase [Tenacibaculum sp. 190524A02b]|uniref:pseudouridine synthase n=1 Tax=Tenacibaculum vairaonense TaxID=3137860 RepID=UPI0032B22D1A